MVLLGGLLALVTWLALTIILISIGLIFVRPAGTWKLQHFAAATWWGLAIVTLVGYLLAFFVPLRSMTTTASLITISVILGFFGWRSVFQAHRRGRPPWPRWNAGSILLAFALVITWTYLALAALGPVTHYDAGLYQWAAVQYAGDFPVIPGLANLYGPLGYAGAEPILGAVLGNTAWTTEGFRLLNGAFLVFLGWEAICRFISHPRRAGTAIALTGTALVYAPMIWMADFWVTSPTPDLPVLVLAVVAAAHLADLATGNNAHLSSAATIVILAALMTALRPTAVVLAVGVILAAIAITVIKGKRQLGTVISFPVLAAVGIAVALGALVVARDRMLSGWLQYPASLHPFDVPWRAPDPEPLRSATLGFARDPQDWQEAAAGWNWVGGWISRLPEQWEPWWLLAALLAGITLLIAARSRSLRWRALVLVSAPFAVATLTWWALSPPALRFGWGPLFGLAAVLVGWGIWRLRIQRQVVLALAGGIALLSVVGAIIRLDWTSPREVTPWLGIPLEVVPLPVPETEDFTTDSGLVLQVPTQNDQCWSVYPLCTPVPDPGLTQFSKDIGSGFVS